MQKLCTKFCLMFMLITCVINTVGCSSDSGQDNLVLEKTTVVEALRLALAKENMTVFTPTTTEFTLSDYSIALTPIALASLRADDLPDVDNDDVNGGNGGNASVITTAWNLGFTDVNGIQWTLKIPESGVSYINANEATIIGFVEVGQGRLNVTVNMIKEGTSRENEWVINKISVEEKYSVSTGIMGKITNSVTGLAVQGVSVSAFAYPYVHGDQAKATTNTDSDGNYKLFLPSGTYMVVADESGFQQANETVVVY